MRIYIVFIYFFLSFPTYSQNIKVVNWINANAIKIEDANPDTQLITFKSNIPKKFENAKIFGFGEATHHGKEFFDIKTKFFKFLVENQDVKVFIIEDSYTSEFGINEWISGGKGNVETIAENFSIYPWHCKEVVNLLKWIRNYNLTKTDNEKIRFYGMDIQNVQNINNEIRYLVKKYNITMSEELLSVADACANKKIEYNKKTDWADKKIPKLKEIERILSDFQKNVNNDSHKEFTSTIRALNYLIKYTYYLQNSKSTVRDLMMFENVKWIIENETSNGKAFIWAHNEHINNKEMLSHGSGWINLGAHLKEHYKDDYYSVGFDFGKGTLRGFVVRKNEPNYWETYQIDEPFRKTYSKTLFEAKEDIYFIDMRNASKNIPSEFFNKKSKQLILGASGFNPEKYYLIPKKFSEMYDGLIFVKNISIPNYELSEK
ncbi:erythromycin esterase family protein [Kordia zhangzhouensis]|uniref:erythromycin esterase family protein n=1 Tax=Kordia zhangzhouensis TaxID=1620405 RepID=UPI0006298C7C|nr:erythromycin esterase family protein [Kordia zhangzhouensis]